MVIDLRPLDPLARVRAVLDGFAALGAGQGVVLLAARKDGEALAALQARHAGQFDWFVLADEPEEHQAILSRRAEGAPRRRTTLEFMETDHRRVDTLLAKIQAAAEAQDAAGVHALASQLKTGLAKHFRMEEELLLPVVAERLGSPRGPAIVLRDDHLFIASLVDKLIAQSHVVASGQVAAMADVVGLAKQLVNVLANHAGMEERLLYAVTDLLLSDVERDELVRRCQVL